MAKKKKFKAKRTKTRQCEWCGRRRLRALIRNWPAGTGCRNTEECGRYIDRWPLGKKKKKKSKKKLGSKKRNPAMTYKQAMAAHLAELEKLGWDVKKDLKVPHATSPDGKVRLWFKTQAIYFSSGSGTDLGSARSLWVEAKTISTEKLVASAVAAVKA